MAGSAFFLAVLDHVRAAAGAAFSVDPVLQAAGAAGFAAVCACAATAAARQRTKAVDFIDKNSRLGLERSVSGREQTKCAAGQDDGCRLQPAGEPEGHALDHRHHRLCHRRLFLYVTPHARVIRFTVSQFRQWKKNSLERHYGVVVDKVLTWGSFSISVLTFFWPFWTYFSVFSMHLSKMKKAGGDPGGVEQPVSRPGRRWLRR